MEKVLFLDKMSKNEGVYCGFCRELLQLSQVCADRKKVIQECKNPMVEGDFNIKNPLAAGSGDERLRTGFRV